MRSLLSRLIMFAVMVSLISSASADEARQIMEKVAEKRKIVGSEAVSVLEIYNPKGQKRVRKTAMVSKMYNKEKIEKKLIRFLSPADVKGTGLLTFDHEVSDDDMWLFMPALRKTRRIVSSEKSKSFMGSEFSYADMNVPNIDEFTYKIEKSEVIDGADCWVITSTPKNEDIADEYGFSKRLLWIDKKIYMARKSTYYDLEGDLQKEMTITDIRLVDKKTETYRAFHMEMKNVQNDRRSVMKIEKFEYTTNIKDDYFTTRYLERI